MAGSNKLIQCSRSLSCTIKGCLHKKPHHAGRGCLEVDECADMGWEVFCSEDYLKITDPNVIFSLRKRKGG